MKRPVAFALSVLAVVLLGAQGRLRADQASAPPSPSLSRAEAEAFLQHARVVKTRAASKGITGTIRATLTDGTFTHDASIQTIDESRAQYAPTGEVNFRDSWRYNVAAYRLDQLLGLDMVPVTVQRSFQNKDASFTWWVDDVLMDEGARLKRKVRPPDPQDWNEQMWTVRVFDQLIYNVDRNVGNLVITSQWRIWMIDHTRAFRWQKSLKSPGNLTKCDRRLLERLRQLDRPTLEKAMDDYLLAPEIEAVLARRDAIVRYFERAGESAIYDGPPR